MVESTTFQKYLVHFRKNLNFIDFCLQELEALADMHGITKEKLYAEDPTSKDIVKSPFIFVYLPSVEVCTKIVNRSIMIREIIDVFSSFKIENFDQPNNEPGQPKYDYQKLVDYTDTSKLLPILEKRQKFKFNIEGVGRHIHLSEQILIIELFKVYPFYNEDLSLDNPEVIYKIVENKDDGMVYFGLQVACYKESEKSGKGKNDDTFFGKYSLKKRPYLGPTSTDHELAFLMANQA